MPLLGRQLVLSTTAPRREAGACLFQTRLHASLTPAPAVGVGGWSGSRGRAGAACAARFNAEPCVEFLT
jgi:hypothetical protein